MEAVWPITALYTGPLGWFISVNILLIQDGVEHNAPTCAGSYGCDQKVGTGSWRERQVAAGWAPVRGRSSVHQPPG